MKNIFCQDSGIVAFAGWNGWNGGESFEEPFEVVAGTHAGLEGLYIGLFVQHGKELFHIPFNPNTLVFLHRNTGLPRRYRRWNLLFPGDLPLHLRGRHFLFRRGGPFGFRDNFDLLYFVIPDEINDHQGGPDNQKKGQQPQPESSPLVSPFHNLSFIPPVWAAIWSQGYPC